MSVGIMLTDKNKNSFCPAKWQDVSYNAAQGYLYACPKSCVHDPADLEKQRDNMMNGIQDPSCDYCWKLEAKGQRSLRHEKLEEWDGTLDLLRLDVTIGNLCNLQCSYCCPPYSSQWQSDINKNGEYKMLFGGARINTPIADPYIDHDHISEYVKNAKPKDELTILGGEPLIHPLTIPLLEKVDLSDVHHLSIPTNMNYKKNDIALKLAEIAETKTVWVKPSWDTANDNISSYIRLGFDPALFYKNVNWMLEHTKINLEFLSLISAHTIWALGETYQYITNLTEKYGDRIRWIPTYCHYPVNQTFDIFTDDERNKVISMLEALRSVNPKMQRIDVLLGAVRSSEYNQLARLDQQNFFKQFNERHNITTPEELKFLIEDCK